jgi:AmmeMemoRadiSam system protein B/AmmeMemoRadiSam system protein A
VRPHGVAIALLLFLALTTVIGGCTEEAPPPSGSPSPTTTPHVSSPPQTVDQATVRKPAVAGAFYPDDAEALANMVDTFLEAVRGVDGEPIGLVVPHAGYVYSGWVAAYAFRQLEGVDYDTIVIIGPNHYLPGFEDISVYAHGAYETPLGLVPVDEEVAGALIDAHERITFHPEAHAQEHSIEVQLPFLQRLYQDLRIVPIVIGQPTEKNVDILSQALVQVLPGRRALLIASSDMSHYPAYEDAVRVDTATLAAMETGNPQLVIDTVREHLAEGVTNLGTCLCGEGPVLAVLKAAPQLGADQVTILQYANSADSPFVSGDRSRVVGYGTAMLWRYEPPDLGTEERERLLSIARESIAQYVTDGTFPEARVDEPDLLKKSGAFVTLELDGELRGCIGHIQAQDPLYSTVQQAAVSAATQDPRFSPLSEGELGRVTIEISVLSPLKRITDIEEIEVGTHGLLISAQGRQGLLLPQVATEEGWNRDEFLQAICRKAGLPQDAWRDGAALYTFTAIVFGEAH